jgi:hypothetical protein
MPLVKGALPVGVKIKLAKRYVKTKAILAESMFFYFLLSFYGRGR